MTGRTRKTILVLLLGMTMAVMVRAEDGLNHEYKLKSAVIFKLLKFVSFPAAEKDKDGGDSKGKEPPPRGLVIGVCAGADQAFKAMQVLQGQTVKGRKITVRKLSEKDLLGTKKLGPVVYDVLFVPRPSRSQKKPLVVKAVLKRLKSPNALTIGEVSGFIDSGGIISLLKDKNRIRFEINLVEARRAKIKINSSLLKLAKRLISPPKEDD